MHLLWLEPNSFYRCVSSGKCCHARGANSFVRDFYRLVVILPSSSPGPVTPCTSIHALTAWVDLFVHTTACYHNLLKTSNGSIRPGSFVLYKDQRAFLTVSHCLPGLRQKVRMERAPPCCRDATQLQVQAPDGLQALLLMQRIVWAGVRNKAR